MSFLSYQICCLHTLFSQNSGKFARQLSSPAYFNPKIRVGPNMNNQVIKGSQLNGPMNQGNSNRQNSPVGEINQNRSVNGFPNNYQNRNGNMRHSPQKYVF